MEAFVTDVGRRVLRRPLTADEVAELTEHGLAAAVEADRFEQGIDILVAVLLQHPEFLYRVEIGQEVPDVEGVAKLTGYEIATRLSYLLWGTTPTDELLDMAEAGVFDDPEVDEIGDIARDMLGDEQAGEQLDRFHAMWLGYGTLGGGDPLIEPMREEIRAFVRRVVFEDERPWKNLLTFDQTYVTPDLAEHYGIEPPNGDAGWVSLGEDRAGLLSLGGFLALFPGDEDTDPILRGKLIREQFLCMEIVRPDDINPANMDPVEDAVCKKDILGAHTQGTCAGCHTLMDPIGYGLEQYDVIGAFRTQEPGLDECKLDGNGELDGTPFNGPQELGALMAEYRLFQDCALTQLHRFASGHAEFEPADREFLDVLRENPDVLSGEIGLVSLVVDYVAMPQFGFRRDEAEQ
jgi:hypothetical protein